MKHLITLIFICLLSAGYSQRNAQERAEEAVKTHLKNVFSDKYKSYGFETLYKVSPPRIVEVENLKYKIDVLRKNNMLTDSSLKYYDSIIKLKVDTIKANKEFSTYDISHYYVLKEEGKNTLHYTKFYLTPDGKIKDVDQMMSYELIGKEYDWFYSYYRRNPMLPNDLIENKKCFTYLDNLLQTGEDKETTMATVINTYRVIASKGYLDTVSLPMILSSHWLKKNMEEEIIISKFSKVKLIRSEEGVKLGYNIFVEFEKEGVKNAHYFEFDPNFILTGTLPVEKPYDSYFK